MKAGKKNEKQQYLCKACHYKFIRPVEEGIGEEVQAKPAVTCIRCTSTNTIKFGIQTKRQRYYCQTCHYSFLTPDQRTSHQSVTTKNLPTCKRCKKGLTIKFGILRRTQRYYCKKCDYEFILVKGKEKEVKRRGKEILKKKSAKNCGGLLLPQ